MTRSGSRGVASAADSTSDGSDAPGANYADANLFVGVLAFAVLGFALPFYSIPNLHFDNALTIVIGLVVAYCALRLSLILAFGAPQLLACSFWTFAYSFLTLPLLAQAVARQYPLITAYEYGDSTWALGICVVVVGIAGYEAGRSVRIPQRRRIEGLGRLPVPAGISAKRALILGYVGLAFVLLAVAQHGLGSFFVSRTQFTSNFLGSAPAGVKFYLNTDKASGVGLQALTQVPIFVGTYLLLYLRHNARKLGSEAAQYHWLLIVPLILGNVIVNNPIANARFWAGAVAISYLTIYLPLRGHRWVTRLYVVVFIGVSLFSFHQLAAFRNTGTRDFSSKPIQQSLITDPDYASPQQLLNGIEYVRQSGYEEGRQLSGALLVWVPRAVWPDKPRDTGQLIGAAAGFKVSDPLWTEGQVDFGLPGTFVFLAVIGFLTRRLDSLYRRPGPQPLLVAACTPVIAGLIVFILRGTLQPAFGSLLPVVACALFCMSYRRRAQDESRTPESVVPPTASS